MVEISNVFWKPNKKSGFRTLEGPNYIFRFLGVKYLDPNYLMMERERANKQTPKLIIRKLCLKFSSKSYQFFSLDDFYFFGCHRKSHLAYNGCSTPPPPTQGFIFKMCINYEPMIAKIVVWGLDKTHFRDFKNPKILTVCGRLLFLLWFSFWPYWILALGFSQKMGQPIK